MLCFKALFHLNALVSTMKFSIRGFHSLCPLSHQVECRVWVQFKNKCSKLRSLCISGCSYGEWALVTGATDGIGRAFTIQLAKKKINAVIVGRTQSKLEEFSKELTSKYSIQVYEYKIRITISCNVFIRFFPGYEPVHELDMNTHISSKCFEIASAEWRDYIIGNLLVYGYIDYLLKHLSQTGEGFIVGYNRVHEPRV